MTPKQIGLIKVTWGKVFPIADKAAELFYGKLFELDPELKPLFSGNMVEQGKKLMSTINLVVEGLENLEELVPAVQDLGIRHAGYGVKDEHYDTVAEALLWTLGQGLGDDFTDEVKEAWTEAYVVLATTMKDAAASAAA
ncbi:MAG: globin family protein [Gammaproteobacteria bacterium]|jgi:hemoglobin-like flavoprotein